MTIRIFFINGKKFEVKRSNRKNKKFAVRVNNKTIHFGASGFTIAPGTSKGDRFCTRSSGIKGVNNINSANFWARKMWNCIGKKSVK